MPRGHMRKFRIRLCQRCHLPYRVIMHWQRWCKRCAPIARQERSQKRNRLARPVQQRPGVAGGMTTRDAVRELSKSPGFCAMSLEAIGEECGGVSRERVRQILGGEGIKKRYARKLSWLEELSTAELVQMALRAGSVAKLAKEWGISDNPLHAEVRKRGLVASDLRLRDWGNTKTRAELSPEEWRAYNTKRCLQSYYSHREQRIATIRAWQRANPEKTKEYQDRYQKNHPEKVRLQAQCSYRRIQGGWCEKCKVEHSRDDVRWEQLQEYYRLRNQRKKEERLRKL